MKTSLRTSKNVFAATCFTSKLYLLVFAAFFCFSNGLYAGVRPTPHGRHIKRPGPNARALKVHRSNILTSPTISYTSPQTFTAGQRVSVAPVSGGITPYGYNVYSEGGDTVITATKGVNAIGITMDAAGDIYFTDAQDVYELPAGGGALKVIASGFNSLTDVKVDAALNIYVVDQGASRVIKIAASSSSQSVIGTGITSPFNLALDAAGNVYVGEYTGATTGDIKKIAAGTGTTTVFAATGLGPVAGLAFDAAGNLFLADDGTNVVKEIPADGGGIVTVMQNIGGDGLTPNTLAIDHSGTLFVSAFDANDLTTVSIFYKLPGGINTSPAEFDTEDVFTGITTDAAGNVYAASDGTADGFGYAGIIKYQPAGGFFISQNLPAGLNFDGTKGIISGIPVAASPSTSYMVTAYQTDSATTAITSASATVNISVNGVAGPATSYTSPQAYPVNYPLTGTGPINSGGLPGALNYSPGAFTIGSGFSKPNGIARDAAGNLYIADRGNNLVKKITGNTITVIGSGFSKPTGVAVDAAGNVYVADNGNNAVKKIPAGSNTPVLWGSGFSAPLGIAVDIAGNVYVADKGHNAIKEILTNGTTIAIGGSGFNAPSGVAVDAAGNVYVADSGIGAVQLIPPGGSLPQLLTYGLSNPFGVAVDNAGNIFVADQGDNTVYSFNVNNPTLNFVGQEFNSPEGIMIDSQGNLYIADTGNNAIKSIQPDGGYFLSNALPAGLLFDSSTGIISGTPTVITPAANYTAVAWNPTGNSFSTFSLQVTASPLLSGLALSTGTLSPVFAPLTNNYTASVSNKTASVTITPTTIDANATVKVNGTMVASGTASAAISLSVGQNTISIVVTARDGTTTGSYTVMVTRISSDAYLADLTVQTATLSPAFAYKTLAYTAGVSNATTSVTVKPFELDATALSITVNGTSVANKTASAPITLAVGANKITIVITAQDGVTTQTYTVTITRASSTNAGLAGLSVSNGSLSPAFASTTTGYSVSEPNTVSAITITPTTSDPDATVIVNGASVTSGDASASQQLAVGTNTINTIVTASDGETTKTYTITVTRAAPPSNNAGLSNLTISSGALTPGFTTNTTSYTVSVINTVSTITVTPTTSDANATVKVNGIAVVSGSASAAIPLAIGGNAINIVSTAQDGVTVKTYTVTVTRASSNNANLAGLSVSSGSLSPAFASTTTGYSVSEPNTVSAITITPTTSDPDATVIVNGTAVTSGTASASQQLAVGSNTITTIVTASDGATTKTYTIMVTRGSTLSSNAGLSGLAISSGALTPAFATGTASYTASVSNATASITVTPTTSDVNATVKVNGTAVTSGSASQSLPLVVGPNNITTIVTAQDGTTKKTYTVMVTRAPSTNASLSAFKISNGTLSPSFATGTTSYTAGVGNGLASMTVTPTAADPTATITVNGTAVTSGTASGPIVLNVGPNAINTVVTAQDGTTIKTYTVTVTRAPSTNASLSAFKISNGTLSPSFAPGTTSYTAGVGNGLASMTVTPTAADPNATITVNGTAVTSGSASQSLPLVVGPNNITTVVTAQDGTTIKTYTVTVTRAPSTNASLSAFKVSNGTLSPVFATGTTSYTAGVGNGLASMTVTPTATNANATITVNGTAVTSGTASGPIALNVGPNAINTVVTAQDGTTKKTYTVTVTRAPSTNASLSAFKISNGTLSPAFATGTTSYTAGVGNGLASMTVTPIAADPTATITVNGTAVTSGSASQSLPLVVGPNNITTIVTAQDGVTAKTYTLTVTRASGGADSYVPIAIGTGISVSKPTETPALADDGIAVHQGVSPNGDGINDFLQIDNISQYPDNKLMIMNRNGQLIYEASGYNNSSKVFDGHSSKNRQMQLPGTYFYQLDYTVSGITKHKTGFLVLKY